jgi:hypothetical protein
MGTKIDGPITSEAIDSSGEVLDLKGHDITDFLEGRAFANWEHENKSPETIVGRFIYAKKIFKAEDCENDRQREFWKQLKLPFLYGICELMDAEDHPGAVAVAAMLRYFKNRKEKVQIGFSVEGSTLHRDGNLLERSVGRRAAITLRPCNRTCWVDMIGDAEANTMLDKSEYGIGHSTHTVEVDSAILEDAPDNSSKKDYYDIRKALTALNKTLTAGNSNVAPGQLVGGAALVREDIVGHSMKNRLKAALRDWNRTRPLKEAIKAALPEVADSYIDHFTQLAHDMSLRKSHPIRVGAQHAQPSSDDEQKKLAEGLYFDTNQKYEPGHSEHSGSHNSFYRLKNDSGQSVFAKPSKQSRNAEAYYKVASDYFGLGKHVPVTATVSHEKLHGGQPIQIMEFSSGQTPMENEEKYNDARNEARASGLHQKLHIMDHVLGHSDRHGGNVIVDDNNTIKHIDNDSAFSYTAMMPDELNADGMSPDDDAPGADPIHPDVAAWLHTLDVKHLAHHLFKQNIGPEKIKQALAALKMYKKAATNPNLTLSHAWNLAHGAINSVAPRKDVNESLDNKIA